MIESLNFSGMKMPRMISFFRAHKGAITFFLVAWLVFFVFWLIPNWSEGPFYFVFFSAMFLVSVASQLFWIRHLGELGKRLVPRKRWRKVLGAAGSLVYLLLLAFNLFAGINRGSSWNVRAGPLDAPFEIWFVGSVLGFFIIMYTGAGTRKPAASSTSTAASVRLVHRSAWAEA